MAKNLVLSVCCCKLATKERLRNDLSTVVPPEFFLGEPIGLFSGGRQVTAPLQTASGACLDGLAWWGKVEDMMNEMSRDIERCRIVWFSVFSLKLQLRFT